MKFFRNRERIPAGLLILWGIEDSPEAHVAASANKSMKKALITLLALTLAGAASLLAEECKKCSGADKNAACTCKCESKSDKDSCKKECPADKGAEKKN